MTTQYYSMLFHTGQVIGTGLPPVLIVEVFLITRHKLVTGSRVVSIPMGPSFSPIGNLCITSNATKFNQEYTKYVS